MGVFEFQSEFKAGSKQNMHDARMKMLEEFGAAAVSWVIDDVQKKNTASTPKGVVDGQLELDFRDPIEPPERKKRSFERGLI